MIQLFKNITTNSLIFTDLSEIPNKHKTKYKTEFKHLCKVKNLSYAPNLYGARILYLNIQKNASREGEYLISGIVQNFNNKNQQANEKVINETQKHPLKP